MNNESNLKNDFIEKERKEIHIKTSLAIKGGNIKDPIDWLEKAQRKLLMNHIGVRLRNEGHWAQIAERYPELHSLSQENFLKCIEKYLIWEDKIDEYDAIYYKLPKDAQNQLHICVLQHIGDMMADCEERV